MLTPSTCSPDTAELWGQMPVFVQEQDAGNGYPFLSWLEGAGSMLQVLDDLVRDDNSGNPGWSIALDVDRCPAYALPWLGQFVGVRFSSPALTEAQMRSIIELEPGFSRGTLAAFQLAADALLAPGYHVSIVERTLTVNGDDPYALLVLVPTAGLTSSTWAALVAHYATWTAVAGAFGTWADVVAQSGEYQAALLAAKPAGLKLTLQFV